MTNTEPSRQSRRRKQAVAGAVGVAAILGGGAFLVTQQLTDDAGTVVQDTGAMAPLTPAAPESVTPSASAFTPKKSAAPTSRSASPSTSPTSKTPKQRIAEARAAASKAGTQVRRPLPPTNGGAIAASSEVTVTNTGSLKDGGTMRVVSAKQDLTGQRELRWAADDGETVANARCTQNFVFSSGSPAKERPTMLLCWRTSAERSVITVAVTANGRPSAANSVSILNKQWARLG
jgi:hypothetical protein